ncbi:ABC-type oligopeptide transporter ABCB9 isoform X2 [Larimichthys crocea]|uniref:ABC-type oligopeptide transporter ABCB9 isoform X2 n=1 Tax=Larimichthys crocea TaxID=215358 RepID=UPI0009009D35|nr:ATP-binding cassette sub-family B member 9 isoform X2 [Larimichthys crocea]
MSVKVVVSCSVLYAVLDVAVVTVLYTHGSQLSVFKEDVLNFDIRQSVLDLWGAMLLRAPLLLGACIGVSWNREDGPSRVAKLTTLIVFICLIIINYTLAKMLMLTELQPLTHQPWLLSMICWTCASSVGVMLLWSLLGSNSLSSSGGGGRSEDTENLVEAAGEVEQEVPCDRKKEGNQEKEKTSSGATLGRLLSYCRKDSGLLSVAVLFLLISAVCEVFIPYYYGEAIDSIVVHQSMEYLAKPVITLLALSLASSLAMGVRGGVFTLTFARLNLRLRNHLFRTLMRQEIAFFDENHTGDIISRLSSDTTQVSDLISQNVNIFLRSSIKGAGDFIFMCGMSWKLSLVTIMGFPLIALVSKLYGEFYKKLTKEVQTTLAEANKVAEETISAMKTVRSFANECGEADSYYAKLLAMYQLNKKQALAYACYMWSSSGVSFTLRPGEVTALVGPSGSGKSSCVNLLENFYLPQQGQVLLDGKPVHTYQHDYLHSKVALVGQEPVLFARTVEENITYGLTDTPIESVVQAATKANAHDFITALPKGYDTSVGEKGTQLSGGQKQRVAIARALIRNPRVLILDEATSALDTESEHIVQQALSNIMQEHTVLVIAHRLSTVEKADNIIVIDKGHVAEQGSHSQLMASGGLYCKLVQRQVLGIGTEAEVLNPSEKLGWKPDGGRQRRRQISSSDSESECNLNY